MFVKHAVSEVIKPVKRDEIIAAVKAAEDNEKKPKLASLYSK
jgi:hypothetical protein